MNLNKLEQDFLIGFLFCPKEVWLPNEYKPIMKRLNVWGRNVINAKQKDRMLARSEFRTRGTLFHTGDDIKELRME